MNDAIRNTEVRVIDHNGGQVGVIATSEAIQMAKDVGLDLVEVALMPILRFVGSSIMGSSNMSKKKWPKMRRRSKK